MKKSSKSGALKIITSQPFILLVLIIIVAVVTNSMNGKFLTWVTINSILGQAAGLGLVSAGATILVISGHFDISTGRMVGLAMCSMALMLNAGMNPVLVSVLGILICVACSVLNGVFTVAFNAPSFVVTLATQNIFYSIALLITNGYMQTLYGNYRSIASYRIFGIVPFLYVILFLGFAVTYYILKHTRTGRQVYAIGTNQRAAYISGLNVKLNKIKFFAISGVLVGIASMVMLSRISAAQATTGYGMETEAIGAVVIGGSSINGGKGGVVGTFVGVILLSMISTAINMLHINAFYEYMIYGIIIIMALAITAIRNYTMANKN
ncbi:MAG: ABC transporter permease [Lachnospiraceae bacterium]|nr:ABC transporter permease [Lachnospiraceae bacterium]